MQRVLERFQHGQGAILSEQIYHGKLTLNIIRIVSRSQAKGKVLKIFDNPWKNIKNK